MTRQELETWLEGRGWSRDRRGHYHKTSETPEGSRSYRFRLGPLSARYEVRNEELGEWVRIKSGYYRSLVVQQSGALRGMTT